ncbi:class I SAM-dependent methyltransferase [Nocardioides sp. C4-1]|uniref:class I SAM-dependent methyltransferase n=1 Tax=Nocardioides sp. C4-1 TaxID=3151851 RepID=UPI003265E943
MPGDDVAVSPSRWRADLRRSIRLLDDFRYEQPDPDRFYRALADDSVGQLSSYLGADGLRDAVLLDVGGGPGYFRDAFQAAGATYWALDADVGELAGLGRIAAGTVVGSGLQLPFRDACLDVCYSSNVLEHVPDPWRMAEEMVRVTRSGGLVFLSYTVWWGPWGGHETAPWHYLGGARARRRYRRTHGREPKNRYGESLFAVTVAAGVGWARRRAEQPDVELVALLPRYHPRWARWVVRVPVLRELVTWNLVVVLRKR